MLGEWVWKENDIFLGINGIILLNVFVGIKPTQLEMDLDKLPDVIVILKLV